MRCALALGISLVRESIGLGQLQSCIEWRRVGLRPALLRQRLGLPLAPGLAAAQWRKPGLVDAPLLLAHRGLAAMKLAHPPLPR
ncbi:hypothetical protein ACFX2A_023985 [Malus domestica]